MKKLIINLLFLISVPYLFSFSGGTGTESDPYQISTRADWNVFVDSVRFNINPNWSLNKYFILTQDITDVVYERVIGRNFRGHFNGKGYKITVEIPSALFSMIDEEAIIDSLILDGIVGIPVGNPTSAVGTIATENRGIIRNCVNYASLSALVAVGGIVGRNRKKIEDCINYGTITTENVTAGGIVGYCYSGVSRCINIGSVTASMEAGGIIGSYLNEYCDTISDCLNLGNIKAKTYSGGIVGAANAITCSAIIINCINAGYIKAENYRGGILGNNQYNVSNNLSYIINCINTGVIEGIGPIDAASILSPFIVYENCHYDKQMCIHGVDFPGVSGHITRNMVGRKLASLLGDIDWTYVEGATLIECLYPQLKVFSESPDKRKSDASKAGASPIFLYDGIKD